MAHALPVLEVHNGDNLRSGTSYNFVWQISRRKTTSSPSGFHFVWKDDSVAGNVRSLTSAISAPEGMDLSWKHLRVPRLIWYITSVIRSGMVRPCSRGETYVFTIGGTLRRSSRSRSLGARSGRLAGRWLSGRLDLSGNIDLPPVSSVPEPSFAGARFDWQPARCDSVATKSDRPAGSSRCSAQQFILAFLFQ